MYVVLALKMSEKKLSVLDQKTECNLCTINAVLPIDVFYSVLLLLLFILYLI